MSVQKYDPNAMIHINDAVGMLSSVPTFNGVKPAIFVTPDTPEYIPVSLVMQEIEKIKATSAELAQLYQQLNQIVIKKQT